MSMHNRRPSVPVGLGHRLSRRKDSVQHPKPPLTPNSSTIPHTMSNPLLPSAPASPPTPAPSPTPHQRSPTSWNLTFEDPEDLVLEEARQRFIELDIRRKENWLRSLVDACDNHSLSFLHRIVSPRLKKDPFKALPNELCFRVGANLLLPALNTSPLTVSRYLNSSMTPKHLPAPRKFQEGGVKFYSMIRRGRLCARSTRTDECLAIRSDQASQQACLRVRFYMGSIFDRYHLAAY